VSTAVDEVLAALADPTRRRLLDVLAALGDASASSIATQLPVSRQAIVKHLAVLDRAGLVAGRRHGREVRYAVQARTLRDAAQWMTALAAQWDARLDAIRRLAESSSPT